MDSTKSGSLSYRLRWRLICIALLALIILTALPVVAQTPPDVTLDIHPTTLTLHGDRPNTVTIIAHNAGGQPVTDLTLQPFTDLPLTISDDLTPIATLSAGGETTWTLTVTPTIETPITGAIFFRLDYTWMPTERDTAVGRTVLGELMIDTPEKPQISDVATLNVQFAPNNLNEQRPGQLYLVLENKHTEPIHVSEIAIEKSSFVETSPIQADFPFKIDSGLKLTIPIIVTPTDRVQPGKTLLLFAADLSWEDQEQPYQGTLVATQEVEVGVLGESQILAVLGIPALLLLPGFLVLLTIRILWSIGKSKEEKDRYIKTGSSEFWFLAILISLIVAYSYPLLTGNLLNAPRNYLTGYGLVDIYYLYLGSVLLGTLIYLGFMFLKTLILVVKRITNTASQWWEARRTPTETDAPDTIIRKLKRRGMTAQRERVRVTINGQTYAPAYILQAQDLAADTYWVAPPIRIEREGLDDDLVEQLYDLMDTGEDLDFLEQKLSQLKLKWADWPTRGPQLVTKEHLEFENRKEVMIEFG